MTTILYVEDNDDHVFMMTQRLRRHGIQLRHVETGEKALLSAMWDPPAAVLLDINLPGPNGLQLLLELKSRPDAPIVFMVSVRAGEAEMLQAFSLGAADYISKPFSLAVLQARMDRWFSLVHPDGLLVIGSTEVDLRGGEVRRCGRTEKLNRKELLTLRCLLANEGQILTRQRLLEYGWGYDYTGTPRTVDTVVSSLRRKLGDPDSQASVVIESTRGLGYRFVRPRP